VTTPDHRAQALAELTAPGAPFETTEADVLGVRYTVFRNRHGSLRDMLTASARHGDATYITIDGKPLTYREHLAQVGSAAAALRDRYGIGPGDRVAILAANCPEYAVTFWAVVSLGAIVSAFNGWWTTDEIRYGIELSEPSLLIGDAKRLERLEGVDHGIPVIEIESGFAALVQHAPGAPLPDQPIDEDDPALILFTSGTTGRAKGALISHRGLVGFVQVTVCNGAVRARSAALAVVAPAAPAAASVQTTTLLTSPMFHVSGLFGGVIMGLDLGMKLVLRRGRFDPRTCCGSSRKSTSRRGRPSAAPARASSTTRASRSTT
jgi:acyl-CoA synthetase (AMP-forming)/AMP-acid ligase II